MTLTMHHWQVICTDERAAENFRVLLKQQGVDTWQETWGRGVCNEKAEPNYTFTLHLPWAPSNSMPPGASEPQVKHLLSRIALKAHEHRPNGPVRPKVTYHGEVKMFEVDCVVQQ